MPSPVIFEIILEHSEPVYGIWCDTCALPSCGEVNITATTPSGRIIMCHTLRICQDCGDETRVPIDTSTDAVEHFLANCGG